MGSYEPHVLSEEWLPLAELGIESRRESAPIPGQFPKLKTLHVWFARRPIVASEAVVLGGLLPAWSSELAGRFAWAPELGDEASYRRWFLRLVGIWGDPVEARRLAQAAKESGVKLKANPYTYRPAFKNSAGADDVRLLHEVLEETWGVLPTVADVTAGGGSIPWSAARFGLPTIANDLNPVAAAVLNASVAIPATLGSPAAATILEWGGRLVERAEARLARFFPTSSVEPVTNYLFVHAVACPRTGRLVPLLPDLWLRKGDHPAAVRLVTHDGTAELTAPRFEVVHGASIDFNPDAGYYAAGRAISPYDQLVVDGDYIKNEARSGRMTAIPYAVVVRTASGRSFRSVTSEDLAALQLAEDEVSERLPQWERDGVVPSGEIDDVSNYERGHRMYGINKWADFFTPRQLLTHTVFVEEFRALIPEAKAALGEERAAAILCEIALMQGKALNYNSRQTSWDVGRQKTRSVFEKHNFAFKWTFVEFPGPRELLPWCLAQLVGAYEELALLLEETGKPPISGESLARRVTVTCGNAAHLPNVGDGTVHHVCMDPPYYANVMYAELADFFYVWLRATLGAVMPEMFAAASTDKQNEAVTNPARFSRAGARKKELANLDYEAKMGAIFDECLRIMRDDGVLTVMFTNKEARAWDALGTALISAGFTVETSWPIQTESESSSHQANKNAAESTIMLVCRKRRHDSQTRSYLEDLTAEIREATREAYVAFQAAGIDGVDLLLSTYGPALAVVSRNWPVYSSVPDENGREGLLRPEDALGVAREEVVRLRRNRLVGKAADIDDLTDFVLMAWDVFRAREFSFDTARLLALAVGGLDIDALAKAKILEKKTGTVRLLEPKERLRRASEDGFGVRADAVSFGCVIDAVQTVLYVGEVDGMHAAKALMDRGGLTDDDAFLATVQGLVNAIPRAKNKGQWINPEAGLLDILVTAYLPTVSIPVEKAVQAPTQASLFGTE